MGAEAGGFEMGGGGGIAFSDELELERSLEDDCWRLEIVEADEVADEVAEEVADEVSRSGTVTSRPGVREDLSDEGRCLLVGGGGGGLIDLCIEEETLEELSFKDEVDEEVLPEDPLLC